jgi:hypothetical protein
MLGNPANWHRSVPQKFQLQRNRPGAEVIGLLYGLAAVERKNDIVKPGQISEMVNYCENDFCNLLHVLSLCGNRRYLVVWSYWLSGLAVSPL